MLDRDFIVFGRTRVYYINDMYNISTGIVEVVEYIDENKNNPDMMDKFTIKIKSNKEYTYIELFRKDVFFSEELAREVLINKLKGHIQTLNEFKFNLVNFASTYGIEAYLYESDADIFIDKCIKGDIVENSIYFNKYSIERDKHYKLVLKVLDSVYSTKYTDITIYNGQFDGVDVDFLTLSKINYPIDYNFYKINVSGIPEDKKDNQFLLAVVSTAGGTLAESEYVNVTETVVDVYNVNVNRFIPFIEGSDFGIQYWIPENKHYKIVLVEKTEDVVNTYTYNELYTYEDFVSDMPISFTSFTKDE